MQLSSFYLVSLLRIVYKIALNFGHILIKGIQVMEASRLKVPENYKKEMAG